MSDEKQIDIDNEKQLRLEALNQSTLAAAHSGELGTNSILERAKRYEEYIKTGNTSLRGRNDNG